MKLLKVSAYGSLTLEEIDTNTKGRILRPRQYFGCPLCRDSMKFLPTMRQCWFLTDSPSDTQDGDMVEFHALYDEEGMDQGIICNAAPHPFVHAFLHQTNDRVPGIETDKQIVDLDACKYHDSIYIVKRVNGKAQDCDAQDSERVLIYMQEFRERYGTRRERPSSGCGIL
jgi:hypothetical protein